jgi:hypothetical protein
MLTTMMTSSMLRLTQTFHPLPQILSFNKTLT